MERWKLGSFSIGHGLLTKINDQSFIPFSLSSCWDNLSNTKNYIADALLLCPRILSLTCLLTLPKDEFGILSLDGIVTLECNLNNRLTK